jgi:hypothetical protein
MEALASKRQTASWRNLWNPRGAATAAVGIFAIPAAPLPRLDALVEIGAPIALLWYWWTFFRDLRSNRARPSAGRPLT